MPVRAPAGETQRCHGWGPLSDGPVPLVGTPMRADNDAITMRIGRCRAECGGLMVRSNGGHFGDGIVVERERPAFTPTAAVHSHVRHGRAPGHPAAARQRRINFFESGNAFVFRRADARRLGSRDKSPTMTGVGGCCQRSKLLAVGFTPRSALTAAREGHRQFAHDVAPAGLRTNIDLRNADFHRTHLALKGVCNCLGLGPAFPARSP